MLPNPIPFPILINHDIDLPTIVFLVYLFYLQVGRNICHGSDSVDSANHEIGLWFGEKDLCNWKQAADSWINEGN